jgi:2-keto-4-pentenoate hydratase/2-oxohepta-3-ene-1,7-dioic acid hydratase in catechol pathway
VAQTWPAKGTFFRRDRHILRWKHAMRFGTLFVDSIRIVAEITRQGSGFRPIRDGQGRLLESMQDLIRLLDLPATDRVPAFAADDIRPMDEAKVLAPIIPARNIMCVGKNYHAHAREFALSGFDSSSANNVGDLVPDAPIVFTKAPETVVGTGDPIIIPHALTSQVDYEAELGVIIGKGGRGICRDAALEHVFGYTIINDVTARDLQVRHKQWFIGKSIDTFCPMGPWIVTADEIDGADLAIKSWVNGELRQDANTADLIFDIPTLIETLSAGLTLIPGDVIATGTPAGVGIGFNPPRFLAPGDEIAIEIGGLGRLCNPVA